MKIYCGALKAVKRQIVLVKVLLQSSLFSSQTSKPIKQYRYPSHIQTVYDAGMLSVSFAISGCGINLRVVRCLPSFLRHFIWGFHTTISYFKKVMYSRSITKFCCSVL